MVAHPEHTPYLRQFVSRGWRPLRRARHLFAGNLLVPEETFQQSSKELTGNPKYRAFIIARR